MNDFYSPDTINEFVNIEDELEDATQRWFGRGDAIKQVWMRDMRSVADKFNDEYIVKFKAKTVGGEIIEGTLTEIEPWEVKQELYSDGNYGLFFRYGFYSPQFKTLCDQAPSKTGWRSFDVHAAVREEAASDELHEKIKQAVGERISKITGGTSETWIERRTASNASTKKRLRRMPDSNHARQARSFFEHHTEWACSIR